MKNKKQFKKISKFKNEEDEKNFWLKKDSTDYLNWKKAKKNEIK